ncbi:hypothetical protein G4B88_025900 [Cannabis sativa]|uniref:RNase H type-1 domain-containing protein n=1 Tax=Cannabis sativa TaxID=3483 RepID=A0A7J6HGA5_CANSA|nr:hypothetical protein G4B88_025900 [Cannabis sativa]
MDWFQVDSNCPPDVSFDEFMVTTLCIVEAVWKERNRKVYEDMKLCVDGAVLAAVLRNEWGEILAIKKAKTLCTDPLSCEAQAVCLATELAGESGLDLVIFQCDNDRVSNAFNTSIEVTVDFTHSAARNRFFNLCRRFKEWGLIHVSRQCNFMAHSVAN